MESEGESAFFSASLVRFCFSAILMKRALFFLVSTLLLWSSAAFTQELCTENGDSHAARITDCSDCQKPDRGLACLHVVISGITENRGVVRMSLYDAEENYNAREHSCRHAVMEVEDFKAGKIFNNLKQGWYAILLFHDANNNHKFDKVMGIPAERFGFSNNVRPGITGAPGFEETRFRLGPDQCVTIEVRLQSLFGP